MNDYTKIPFDTLNSSDITDYVINKLKVGHTVIQVLVDESTNEIFELIGYANDKNGKSYYTYFADDRHSIEDYVIVERMEPFYGFKKQDKSIYISAADIDIQVDSQNIISFGGFAVDFRSMEKYYNGDSFKYPCFDFSSHYEFFISTAQCDIANFGGPMELDFVEQWMIDKGQYNKI